MPAKKQETAKSDKFGGKKAAAFGSGKKNADKDETKKAEPTKKKER
jgi:hypothetical protein